MVAKTTSSKKSLWLKIALLLGVVMLMAACEQVQPATQCPDLECPEVVVTKPPLYENLWATSAHADKTSEAFTHWTGDDPPEIPVECAKCHSRPGFIAFIGADGSTPGVVENPMPVGTTVTCYVCHNEVSLDLNSATFPSSIKVRNLGPEARCIQCHMGRESTPTINTTIDELELADDDAPSADLPFINSHSVSGATPFGTEVQGGFEYEDRIYAGRFERGEDFFSCLQCHDQHTLELKFDTCVECHTINGTEPKDIRVNSTDFDGDGDNHKGIYYEIETFHAALLAAIKQYAIDQTGSPIAYEPDIYPYFFVDTNENGLVEEVEAQDENRYQSWTPRLLRAAYNYNFVTRDPGTYAHNSTYTLQILYDSIEDIGGDVSGFTRP